MCILMLCIFIFYLRNKLPTYLPTYSGAVRPRGLLFKNLSLYPLCSPADEKSSVRRGGGDFGHSIRKWNSSSVLLLEQHSHSLPVRWNILKYCYDRSGLFRYAGGVHYRISPYTS